MYECYSDCLTFTLNRLYLHSKQFWTFTMKNKFKNNHPSFMQLNENALPYQSKTRLDHIFLNMYTYTIFYF